MIAKRIVQTFTMHGPCGDWYLANSLDDVRHEHRAMVAVLDAADDGGVYIYIEGVGERRYTGIHGDASAAIYSLFKFSADPVERSTMHALSVKMRQLLAEAERQLKGTG